MDVRFGLVAIFLILDVISAQFSGLGNRSLRKKRYSSGVKSSQSSFINPSIENNNFQPSSNNNINQLSNYLESQDSRIVFPDELAFITFLHNRNKSILNSTAIDSIDTVDTESSSLQRPVTQGYTVSLPYDTSTLTPNIPVFSTQALDYTISPTPTPPKETHSAVSHLSLDDLSTIKALPAVKATLELKCEEYAREVANTVSRTDTSSQRLGQNVNNTCETLNYLTIRGIDARIGEFPHMVALLGRRRHDLEHICGGILISHTWVLSAAHCTVGPDIRPEVARIGAVSLSSRYVVQGITVGVKSMIRHPDFRPPVMYADIALLKLIESVTFSANIQPACLYQQYDAVPGEVWISGWGITPAGDTSDTLQKLQLDVVDYHYCSTCYNNSDQIAHDVRLNMMCAGNRRGKWGTDFRTGDSGGPLQIRQENECLFRVIGIANIGTGCGVFANPSAYTRVSYYLPWIEENVWPQGQ